MLVTVLIESASEGCSLGIVADAMMDENKDADIAIIVRINGFDVAAQCSYDQSGESVADCLF